MNRADQIVALACWTIGACWMTAEVTADRVAREVRAENVTCPAMPGQPLVNSSRYPSGAVTCRYAPQRGELIERLIHPHHNKPT